MKRSTRKFLTEAECARIKLLSGMYGYDTVCELAGISSATLWALKKRDFQPVRRPMRPMPGDFALVAPGMTQEQLMLHYGTSAKLIKRWRDEIGCAPERGGVKHPPAPADFADFMRDGGTHASARLRYGVSTHLITRWKEDLGLPMPRRERKAKQRPATMIGWADRYFQREAA